MSKPQTTELAALVKLVEGGGSLEVGLELFSSLRTVSDCAPNEQMLSQDAPPTGALARLQIQAVEDALAEKLVMSHEDKVDAEMERSELAVKLARKANYGPLLARALLSHSQMLGTMERYADAKKLAEESRRESLTSPRPLYFYIASQHYSPKPQRSMWLGLPNTKS